MNFSINFLLFPDSQRLPADEAESDREEAEADREDGEATGEEDPDHRFHHRSTVGGGKQVCC